ncbi:MAG TPA: hypothetical protein VGE39_04090 [Prosthecobacter sp.]
MTPTPVQSILVGVGGMILFGWMMLSLFVLDPPGKLTPADVKVFSGKVKSAFEMGSKGRSLDVWLEGQEFPFRCFGGAYPPSFDKDVLATLQPGVAASVSVELEDAGEPRHNMAQNQSFRPFVALELNGKPALTLEKYNQWSEENQKTAHWVLPILFCCCLGLLWSGVQKRKMAR